MSAAPLNSQELGIYHDEGYVLRRAMFSADEIDPASRLLLTALPAKLGRRVADLGAGWGFLSARLPRIGRVVQS